MARKMPARRKDGRFKKGPARKRRTRKRTTARKRTTRRRNPPRKRTRTRKRRTTTVARRRTPARRRRRRNPDLVKMATKGIENASLLLAGEAVTRGVPRQFGLPTTGPTGLATMAAVAVAAGFAADRFFGATRGAQVLAGGLAVPIRQLIAGANIPVLSGALTPGAGAGSYVQPRGGRVVGRINPARPTRRAGLGIYAQPGTRGALGCYDGAAGVVY